MVPSLMAGWSSGGTRRRALVAGGAAVVLLVGGLLGWRLLNGPGTPAAIPSGFDGKWNGSTQVPSEHTEVGYRVVFVAASHTASLKGSGTPCTRGILRVTSATETVMTMRFDPDGSDCTPGTATFTLREEDDKILMHMRPDEGELQQDPYDATLGRG